MSIDYHWLRPHPAEGQTVLSHGRDGNRGPALRREWPLRSRSGSIHRGETPRLHHLLMGTQNRERRRMKQSKRRKQQRERASWQEANPSARGLRGPAGADEMADELILAAAHVDCEGSDDGTHLRCLIDALAQGMGLEGGRDLVARRLGSLLQSDIARVLDSGWAPHEITRVVRLGPVRGRRRSWRAHSRRPRRVDIAGAGAPCPRLGRRRTCGSSTPHPRAGRPTYRRPSPPSPSSSISPFSLISAASDRVGGTSVHTRSSGCSPASGAC